jgi:hypothetical protein
MVSTEHERLQGILDESLRRAEKALVDDRPPQVAGAFASGCDAVFASKTQAYREVLLGCLLARLQDRRTDIRLPYVRLGTNAFSGRSLDENVVNPFLRANSIPSSRGPYLSVFRRSVAFDESTEAGVRDKDGYRALLKLLSVIQGAEDEDQLLRLLDYAVFRFLRLREEAQIELIRLERLSLPQYRQLVDGLLTRQSGGVFPLVLVLSMVEAIDKSFSLSWDVEHQGINVADMAAGVPGDITVNRSGSPWLSIEITERSVDESRVRGAFRDKISPLGVLDYVFMVHEERIGAEAKEQAEKYFAQGYDVNFVDIREWISNTLVTVGREGRKDFQERVITHLQEEGVKRALRVAWNQEMEKLIAS